MNPTTLTLAMILTCTVHSTAQTKTPLHDAAKNGTPAVITALLEAGADPKARDKDGKTPLHVAAYRTETSRHINALLIAGARLSGNRVDIRGLR